MKKSFKSRMCVLQLYLTPPCSDLNGLEVIVGWEVCGEDFWKNSTFRVDLEAFERALLYASATSIVMHKL